MDALKQRKELKSKKPDFRRQDAHKKQRLARSGYRKPRGLHSKMRLHHKGYARMVSPGFGSPAVVKFADPSGLMPFIVSSLADLERIDAKKEGAIIASTVGIKKRIALMEKAKELKITILNFKDADSYIAAKQKAMKEKKAAKKELKKSREEKTKQKAKDAEKKHAEEDKADDGSSDEKKAKEKEEKDKVLTTKE